MGTKLGTLNQAPCRDLETMSQHHLRKPKSKPGEPTRGYMCEWPICLLMMPIAFIAAQWTRQACHRTVKFPSRWSGQRRPRTSCRGRGKQTSKEARRTLRSIEDGRCILETPEHGSTCIYRGRLVPIARCSARVVLVKLQSAPTLKF